MRQVSRAAGTPAWTTFIPKTLASDSLFTTSTRAISLQSRPGRAPLRKRRGFTAASLEPEQKPQSEGTSKGEQYLKLLREITEAETALSNPYGQKMSYEIVRFDEDGLGPRDRYVYVEERDCIGCTHCQTTAPGTFFMEPDHGRARVFSQTGEVDYVIEEAIDTCPVNCIYYVDWEDLVKLENMRQGQVINNWSRLVGGQDITSSKQGSQTTKVMNSGLMRCEDCPHRGCSDCPLYGVGQNPEYLRRKAIRETTQKQKTEGDRKRRRRQM